MNSPKKPYDVAVLGWWYGENYGSILTYYGLNRAIESLGRSVLMVHEPLGYNGWREDWPDDILSMQFARRIGYHHTEQEHYSTLPRLNDQADTFLVGSDQLWNPLIGRVNDDLFLDFVHPENHRVAYATSFGNRDTKKFAPSFIAKHADNLQQFKAISVREKYATTIARDVFGVTSSLVVDPVFLLPRAHYDQLADKGTVSTDGEYLSVFFLDPNPKKMAVARHVADKLGLDKIRVIPNPEGGREQALALWEAEPRAELMAEDGPENFLRTYRDAAYVITDSYHGSCFAAIFGKPFSSIYNTTRGADRFANIMEAFGLGETRRVFETDTSEAIASNSNVTREIDLAQADSYIQSGRTSSLAWLSQALDPATPQNAAAKPRQRFVLTRPTFTANSKGWRISRGKTGTLLKVARGGAAPGNHAWTELPERLTKGSTFRLTIDWTPITASSTVNVHIRNPKTGAFKVIGSVDLRELSGKPREDTFVFRNNDNGFSQVMLGSVHFTGKQASAEVRTVVAAEVPAGAYEPPQPDSGTKGPEKAATPLAIPPNTRSREQIILSVINDPAVQALRARLLELDPALSIFVGRELKEYTHNKVGGPADLLAFPRSADELQTLVTFANDNDLPYRVLGRGSNVIVRDGGVRGLVIVTSGLNYFSLQDGLFTAGAGASFIEASYFLLEHGLSTLEWASGIPGTIGGAVFMNAGTNVSDVRATIKSVKYLDGRGQVREVQRSDITWGKRHTSFQEHPNWIILEATFVTTPGDKAELSSKMLRTVQVRESHFPLESPNHGSTFKWWRAPRLIVQAGLKGYRIGGVQVSTKQPGFFVNVDRATASDYEALVNYTIARVYEHSGFLMEPEVEFIGEHPHRYERYSTDSPVTELEKKVTGPQA